MRKIMTLFILFVFILTSTPVFAADDEGFVAVGDVAIARPVGFVSLVIGTAFFIVAMPFALTSGSVGSTADTLVGEPFRFTFTRPVGDFKGMGARDQGQKVEKTRQTENDTTVEEKSQQAGNDTSVEEKKGQ